MHKNAKPGNLNFRDLRIRPIWSAFSKAKRCASRRIQIKISGLKAGNNGHGTPEQRLCIACGLCCNGAIFADVKLTSTDSAARLKQLGFALEAAQPRRGKTQRPASPTWKFGQPCSAFGPDCKCRIYADRPDHCRKFECQLFQQVKDKRISTGKALETIRVARERFESARSLLNLLGDTDEGLPVAKRFSRTSDRLNDIGFDNESAEVYGRLTLAIHDLNFVLSESFYPGD